MSFEFVTLFVQFLFATQGGAQGEVHALKFLLSLL